VGEHSGDADGEVCRDAWRGDEGVERNIYYTVIFMTGGDDMKKSATKKEMITRDMTLGELVERHPEAAMIMAGKGLHCMGCGSAAWETIEQGCSAHGMSDKDIDKLVEQMNKVGARKK
jgi:hybrid cluster-associated redox disulfide protein